MGEARPAGLLLVGHGSRVARAAEEARTLAMHVRDRVPGPVAVGWLELERPRAVEAGLQLVAAHSLQRLVVQPLLLFSAYHATSDVPDVAAAVDAVDPRVRVLTGRALGPDPRLLTLAAELVAGVSREPDDHEALLVVTSGTSDPDALAQGQTTTRQLAALTGHRWSAHALATLDSEQVADRMRVLAARGATIVTVLSWSLLAGRLVNAAQQRAQEAALDAGLRVRFAGRFGPDPVVADVLADRFHEALRG